MTEISCRTNLSSNNNAFNYNYKFNNDITRIELPKSHFIRSQYTILLLNSCYFVSSSFGVSGFLTATSLHHHHTNYYFLAIFFFFSEEFHFFPTMFQVQENTLRTARRQSESCCKTPAGDTIFFTCWWFCHVTLTIYSWRQFYATVFVSVHIPQVERVQNIVRTQLGPGGKKIYIYIPTRTYGSDGMDDLQLIVRGLIDSELLVNIQLSIVSSHI